MNWIWWYKTYSFNSTNDYNTWYYHTDVEKRHVFYVEIHKIGSKTAYENVNLIL